MTKKHQANELTPLEINKLNIKHGSRCVSIGSPDSSSVHTSIPRARPPDTQNSTVNTSKPIQAAGSCHDTARCATAVAATHPARTHRSRALQHYSHRTVAPAFRQSHNSTDSSATRSSVRSKAQKRSSQGNSQPTTPREEREKREKEAFSLDAPGSPIRPWRRPTCTKPRPTSGLPRRRRWGAS